MIGLGGEHGNRLEIRNGVGDISDRLLEDFEEDRIRVHLSAHRPLHEGPLVPVFLWRNIERVFFFSPCLPETA